MGLNEWCNAYQSYIKVDIIIKFAKINLKAEKLL